MLIFYYCGIDVAFKGQNCSDEVKYLIMTVAFDVQPLSTSIILIQVLNCQQDYLYLLT